MYDSARHETIHHLELERRRALERATRRRSAQEVQGTFQPPRVAVASVLRLAADRLDRRGADLLRPEPTC